MPCMGSHKCGSVIGNIEACSIVFVDDGLHLMCGDMAACVGKAGCLIGQEKPFGEFVENVTKQEESMSTHRESNVLSFTSAKGNF